MPRRAPVQPLWKDLVSFVLANGFPWAAASNHHFRGGWLIFAYVISAGSVLALVLRQVLRVVPLNRRRD